VTLAARTSCACRTSSWQEVDAAPWLPSTPPTPTPTSSAFSYFPLLPLRSKSKGRRGGVGLFPFARWILLQLWRSAGGHAQEASQVRFFVTRIAKQNVFFNNTQDPSAGDGMTTQYDMMLSSRVVAVVVVSTSVGVYYTIYKHHSYYLPLLSCYMCIPVGRGIDNQHTRATMRVRRVCPHDHPSAPLLLVAVCFGMAGGLVRVAGVCSSSHRVLDDSFCQMFRLKERAAQQFT
jgi:hypothetical protein